MLSGYVLLLTCPRNLGFVTFLAGPKLPVPGAHPWPLAGDAGPALPDDPVEDVVSAFGRQNGKP
jgi:hypothetical protein